MQIAGVLARSLDTVEHFKRCLLSYTFTQDQGELEALVEWRVRVIVGTA